MNSLNLIWVKTRSVIPNPKNPRQDVTYKSSEIIRILETKGFEEAIVAYRKGKFYVIISGHRRWNAAIEMRLEEIPIYLVTEPKNTLEELERLGAIQGNQSDWNELEWLIHTLNLSEMNPNYTLEQLAQKLNASVPTVKKRIFVGKFFSTEELEAKLLNNNFSVNMLDTIRLWCLRIKKLQPTVYEDLGEQYIKEIMLQKLENRLLNSEILKGDYLNKASSDDVIRFLTTPNMKINDFIREISLADKSLVSYDVKTNISTIKKASENIKSLKYIKKEEASLIYDELLQLEKVLEQLDTRIQNNIAKQEEK
ncbi:ParB/RepB/Spo0J family partition protein [Lysinibacillus sp. KU-BSD001]|uniref:ParB/RepB/Spo0J family partition protein n=1 Tax=Lysinibacillus sp. KU-BSD001 TaxID=3141328 RepID=UPI0036EDCB47